MNKAKKNDYADYEELFAGTITERREIDNRNVIGYRMKTITAGKIRECEIYPLYNRVQTATMRRRWQKVTRKAQRNLNKRNAQKTLIRLLNANFTSGDVWGTFTYDDKHLPDSPEAAHKIFRNYLRRLSYYMQRKGLGELKYVFVTEYIDKGEEIRIHHHVITNFPDRDIAEQKWQCGGRTQTRRLQPDESGLEGLGRYITKNRGVTVKNKRLWAASHNLKRPKITVSDTAITRRQVQRICAFITDTKEFIRLKNEAYSVTAVEIKYSDYVPGAYIYAKMRLNQ